MWSHSSSHVSTMDIDQSLDAMIKSAPAKKKGGAGGKKRPKKAAPAPKNKVGGVKAKVIAKPRRGPKASAMAVDGAWTHDKFQGQGGATKLAVSNLHVNVTNQDVRVRGDEPPRGRPRARAPRR